MTGSRIFFFFTFSLVVVAQGPRVTLGVRPNTAELQKFLELSDDQVARLKLVQATRLSTAEVTYRDVTLKQQQLTDLLNSGSTDALAIGTLSIEIQRLRARAIAPSNEREQAAAILTSEQKVKLNDLQQALLLRQAADQAAALHLIDYPRVAVTIQK